MESSREPLRITLRRVGRESEAAVQAILDDVPTYLRNVEGVARRPDGAAVELSALPAQCTLEQKFCLLVYWGETAVGFVDIVRDFPAPGTAMLGLLVIREPFQKQSLGRQAYEAVESYARAALRATRIRLGVNDSNPAARGFWEKMGFRATGEVKPYEGIARRSNVIVMVKELPGGVAHP
jgi:ribosomal protein S18 acetylase RimI-like enzyme